MDNSFAPYVLDYFEGFLDKFEAVRRRTDTEALVRCPDPDGLHTNGDEHPSLNIGLSQNGQGPTILLNCVSQGCDKGGILSAVDSGYEDLYPEKNGTARRKRAGTALPGCSLREYADFKKLPLEFLESGIMGLEDDEYWCPVAKKKVPAVRIPYPDEVGDELNNCRTWRTGLHKTEPDTRIRRVSKKKGGELSLYGLHGLDDARKAGYVLLVEGESDCHVLWYHSLPAVGIPGAKNWKDEWAVHLDGIDYVLVCVEPDEAGEEMFSRLVACTRLYPRLEKVRFTDAV